MWPKHKNKCFIFSNKSAEFSGICVIFSTNNLLDNNGLYHTHLGRTISFQQHFIICFSVQLLHQKHYSQEELSKCVQSHVSTDCVCVRLPFDPRKKECKRWGRPHNCDKWPCQWLATWAHSDLLLVLFTFLGTKPLTEAVLLNNFLFDKLQMVGERDNSQISKRAKSRNGTSKHIFISCFYHCSLDSKN